MLSAMRKSLASLLIAGLAAAGFAGLAQAPQAHAEAWSCKAWANPPERYGPYNGTADGGHGYCYARVTSTVSVYDAVWWRPNRVQAKSSATGNAVSIFNLGFASARGMTYYTKTTGGAGSWKSAYRTF